MSKLSLIFSFSFFSLFLSSLSNLIFFFSILTISGVRVNLFPLILFSEVLSTSISLKWSDEIVEVTLDLIAWFSSYCLLNSGILLGIRLKWLSSFILLDSCSFLSSSIFTWSIRVASCISFSTFLDAWMDKIRSLSMLV